MMFLLDTMVPSELRKPHRVDPRVRAWSDGVPAQLQFVSVVSLFEMRLGALRRERDDPAQAHALHQWLDDVLRPRFAGRILPVTLEIADRAAALHIPTQREDHDMFIAATALVHRLTLVTRNTKHFAPTGVRLLNPWE